MEYSCFGRMFNSRIARSSELDCESALCASSSSRSDYLVHDSSGSYQYAPLSANLIVWAFAGHFCRHHHLSGA